MAETHVLQHVAAFAFAMWWTKYWLMNRIIARWRFAVSALSGSILWVYVAYSATNAIAPDGAGGTIAFQSMALSYFAAFMAFVSVIGAILGLLLWTEEEGQLATEGLSDSMKTQFSD